MAILHPSLFELLKGFSALELPKNMRFPDELAFTEVHDFLLTLIDMSYPPSKDYQRTFWKWALSRLENMVGDQDVEIDSRIYDHSLSSLPSASASLGPIQPGQQGDYCPRGVPLRMAPSKSFVTRYWPKYSQTQEEGSVNTSSYHTVTTQESRSLIENGSTGLTTWGASFALADFMINNPELLQGKTVLELGSGTGFLAILACTLQLSSHMHSKFWLTDGNEEALRQGWTNTQLLCNASSTHTGLNSAVIDWADALCPVKSVPLKEILASKIDPDIVLGADLAYDPSLIPSLVETLRLCLIANPAKHTCAFLALPVRNLETMEHFLGYVYSAHLKVEEVESASGLGLKLGPKMTSREAVKIYKISV